MDSKILKSQEQVRSLRGKLHWTGDLDAMRRDRVVEPIEVDRPEIEDPQSGPVDVDPE